MSRSVPYTPGETAGLYIHIPFCKKKCDYCDFYSLAEAEDRAERYAKALKRHIAETAPQIRSTIDTVYFGGGTPILLGDQRISALLLQIGKEFKRSNHAEITIELNPESTERKALRRLFHAGVNRLSFGVQSAVDTELRQLGRIHSFERFEQAYADARAEGYGNISVDLMYGIEGQTMESFNRSLRAVIAMKPEHISCYGLKVEEGTPLFDRRAAADLPSDDEQADLYLLACRLLGEAGYIHYEISNFAQPGFESRHNLKYWRLEPYLGFGAAAHSDFGGKRYSNVRDLNAYIEGIEHSGTVIADMEEIPVAERATEFVMLRLRISEGMDPREYRRRFPYAFDLIEDKLKRYEAQGLARYDGRWSLTEKGFLVSNHILSDLI